MTTIQLSANTYIDNDITNFTEHQIEFLRTIGSKPEFHGMLEPDLERKRSRGQFVCSWLEGSRRITMLVGLYRTLPWPQEGQLVQMRKTMMQESMERLTEARKSFSFINVDNNDPAAIQDYLNRMMAQWNEVMNYGDEEGKANSSYHLASKFIIFGNMMFSKAFHKSIDDAAEATDPGYK